MLANVQLNQLKLFSQTFFLEMFINTTSCCCFFPISKALLLTLGWGAAGKSTLSAGLIRFRILMSTSDPKCSSGFFFFFLLVFWEAVDSRLPFKSDMMLTPLFFVSNTKMIYFFLIGIINNRHFQISNIVFVTNNLLVEWGLLN